MSRDSCGGVAIQHVLAALTAIRQRIDHPQQALHNVLHELARRVTPNAARLATWNYDTAAALCYGWRVVHKRIEFMALELGSNSSDDVATGGHGSDSVSCSLYVRLLNSQQATIGPN